MEFDVMEILHPVIISVLTVLASFIGVYGAKLLRKGIDFIKSKTDQNVFDNAMELAYGIYIYLEDRYDISGMGKTKRLEMERLLLNKYPSLTQTELDSINKAVWLSFNEEWLEGSKTNTSKRIDG